jgi:hypothetical protein
MVKVKEDMTGWIMSEHGVIDSRLIIIKQVEDYVSPNGQRQAQYLCKCNCGSNKDIITRAMWLKSGHTKSCGCIVNEGTRSTHRLTKTRLYSVWNEMKQRCANQNCPTYKDYGGRGISVCEEWKNDFLSFRTWAISLGYKDDAKRGVYTVERIDNNGNYCPENCTLTSMKMQAENRRSNHLITINGETKTIEQWARCFDINPKTVRSRIRYGWSEHDAVTVPKGERRNKNGGM